MFLGAKLRRGHVLPMRALAVALLEHTTSRRSMPSYYVPLWNFIVLQENLNWYLKTVTKKISQCINCRPPATPLLTPLCILQFLNKINNAIDKSYTANIYSQFTVIGYVTFSTVIWQ